MNNQIVLSQIVFDELSRHVNEFEKYQNSILDDNSLIPVLERKKYQQIFMQYSERLTDLLNNAQINDSNDHSLPCVTINSIVEMKNLQNKRTNKIMVIFPLPNQPDSGKTMQTSYNSPMGQALFLKRLGEIVEVKAPGGVFNYQIESIVLYIP